MTQPSMVIRTASYYIARVAANAIEHALQVKARAVCMSADEVGIVIVASSEEVRSAAKRIVSQIEQPDQLLLFDVPYRVVGTYRMTRLINCRSRDNKPMWLDSKGMFWEEHEPDHIHPYSPSE